MRKTTKSLSYFLLGILFLTIAFIVIPWQCSTERSLFLILCGVGMLSMFSIPVAVVSFVFFILWVINLTTKLFYTRKTSSQEMASEAIMTSKESKNLLSRNVSLWTMTIGAILIPVAYNLYYLRDDVWSAIPPFYGGLLLLLLGLPGTFRIFFPKDRHPSKYEA